MDGSMEEAFPAGKALVMKPKVYLATVREASLTETSALAFVYFKGPLILSFIVFEDVCFAIIPTDAEVRDVGRMPLIFHRLYFNGV
jgi:hypothetical protein